MNTAASFMLLFSTGRKSCNQFLSAFVNEKKKKNKREGGREEVCTKGQIREDSHEDQAFMQDDAMTAFPLQSLSRTSSASHSQAEHTQTRGQSLRSASPALGIRSRLVLLSCPQVGDCDAVATLHSLAYLSLFSSFFRDEVLSLRNMCL